jgi:hypothetical protein
MSDTLICRNCGHIGAVADGFVSCCPERQMVPLDSAEGSEIMYWKQSRRRRHSDYKPDHHPDFEPHS